jgi:hypothetical protein
VDVPTQSVHGYHGTTRAEAEQIIASGFRESSDWLGQGVYFFMDAPGLARSWAEHRTPESPCVLQARIDLQDCFDLLDLPAREKFADGAAEYIEMTGAEHINRLLRQRGDGCRVDAAVISMICQMEAKRGRTIRSVRAPFSDRASTWRSIEQSKASRAEHHVQPAPAVMSHIQIAVRDASVISDIKVLGLPGLSPATAQPSHRDPRIDHLLAIGQRLKRERDRATREQEINNTLLELWLAALWRLLRYGSSDS